MTRITTIAWGLFLACSWTWCIGMYLPVIMLKRFGWWGFIVFAVPNVIGCTAFGYVLRSGDHSRALVRRHQMVLAIFSWVTIAYHMFFIAWVFNSLSPTKPDMNGLGLVAAGGVIMLGILYGAAGERRVLWLAVATYAISIAAFFSSGTGGLERISWSGEQPPAHLWLLAPAIALGFLACPYLDLTFHRALQRSPNRHCFAVFGLTFIPMILLTCFIWPPASPSLRWLALAHIAAQSIFTIGAHARELMTLPGAAAISRRLAWILAALVVAPLGLLPRWLGQESLGETIYLRFLGCFGWLFPACVVLLMWAWRYWTNTHPKTIALLVVVIAGVPCYELAFIHDQPWMTLIAIGALGLAALLLPIHRGQAEFTTSSTK